MVHRRSSSVPLRSEEPPVSSLSHRGPPTSRRLSFPLSEASFGGHRSRAAATSSAVVTYRMRSAEAKHVDRFHTCPTAATTARSRSHSVQVVLERKASAREATASRGNALSNSDYAVKVASSDVPETCAVATHPFGRSDASTASLLETLEWNRLAATLHDCRQSCSSINGCSTAGLRGGAAYHTRACRPLLLSSSAKGGRNVDSQPSAGGDIKRPSLSGPATFVLKSAEALESCSRSQSCGVSTCGERDDGSVAERSSTQSAHCCVQGTEGITSATRSQTPPSPCEGHHQHQLHEGSSCTHSPDVVSPPTATDGGGGLSFLRQHHHHPAAMMFALPAMVHFDAAPVYVSMLVNSYAAAWTSVAEALWKHYSDSKVEYTHQSLILMFTLLQANCLDESIKELQLSHILILRLLVADNKRSDDTGAALTSSTADSTQGNALVVVPTPSSSALLRRPVSAPTSTSTTGEALRSVHANVPYESRETSRQGSDAVPCKPTPQYTAVEGGGSRLRAISPCIVLRPKPSHAGRSASGILTRGEAVAASSAVAALPTEEEPRPSCSAIPIRRAYPSHLLPGIDAGNPGVNNPLLDTSSGGGTISASLSLELSPTTPPAVRTRLFRSADVSTLTPSYADTPRVLANVTQKCDAPTGVTPYVELLKKASREMHALRSQRDELLSMVDRLTMPR